MTLKEPYYGLTQTTRNISEIRKADDKWQHIIEESRRFYHNVTSKNGRFSYFECEDKLFPYARPATAEGLFISHQFYEREGNSLLIGEGGIGKTTSLLYAWKTLLDSEKLEEYKLIPLYIPLNEANSRAYENGFIAGYCREEYRFTLDAVDGLSLNGYRLLFLLDGFNEITSGVMEIVTDIRRLCRSENTKVALTSRYDFTSTYMLENIFSYRIQPLSREKIANFLRDHHIFDLDIPYDLLATPMMLTLFTNTNLIKRHISQQIRGGLPFCENNTKGELLYNFMLCQVGKTFDPAHIEDIYIAFLSLFVVSPYIAYTIEKRGEFSFPYNDLIKMIRGALEPYNDETYAYLLENELASLIAFGPMPTFKKEKHVARVAAFLQNTLAILQVDGNDLSFRHQYFRDFFAASHIILDIRLALLRQTIPKRLTERMIPNYIAEFVGDCLQEYNAADAAANTHSLEKVLGSIRHKSVAEVPLIVNNIVNILALARDGNLSGVSFQDVDLSRVSLNGLHFSQGGRKADFTGTKVSANTFLPHGHIEQVRNAVYSKDGSRILTAGDTTVKEWDAITGQCLMTFIGHTNLVNSAVYSQDETLILSAANDNTVREWDRRSGQCRRLLRDHQGYVTKAIYLPNDSGILSASWDGTVLLYRKTGKVQEGTARVVARHDKNVKSIAVSKDGRCCLTASGDCTAKEWFLEDGSCLTVYHGHTDMVNSVMYSPDERSVLTGSYDGTVRIFDRNSGDERFCFKNKEWVRNAVYDKLGESILIASHADAVVKELKRTLDANGKERWEQYTTYSGHEQPVTNVALSPDETRVLSSSEDGSVREWDRLSSQCIRVYTGNMFSTTDTVYSSDGLLVLTIKGSQFSVAKRSDGIPIRTFPCGGEPVTSVDFSPDNRWILSTSADRLDEWNCDTDEKIAYHLLHPKQGYVAEHARYTGDGKQIVCMSKSGDALQQVQICIFDRGHTEPQSTYLLLVNAVGVQPINGESAFFTISSNAVVRKWRMDDGAFLGIDGIEIEGCDFTNCRFLDSTVRKIISESRGICNDLSLSRITIEGQTCQLDGGSLIIYAKDNLRCFSLIDEVYLDLKERQTEHIALTNRPGLDVNAALREFWSDDKYIKLKIDPYQAFSAQAHWTDDQQAALERFRAIAGWGPEPSEDLLGERVMLWILSALLSDGTGRLAEDRYYCKGIVLIPQIDAGVCSLKFQSRIMPALVTAFPNLQFIVSSSAAGIGTDEGAAAALQLGVKVWDEG